MKRELSPELVKDFKAHVLITRLGEMRLLEARIQKREKRRLFWKSLFNKIKSYVG